MTAESRGFLRDNSLSLVFGGLFVVTLVGQALSGLADHNADQVAQGLATLSLGEYLTSSTFGADVMEGGSRSTSVLPVHLPHRLADPAGYKVQAGRQGGQGERQEQKVDGPRPTPAGRRSAGGGPRCTPARWAP